MSYYCDWQKKHPHWPKTMKELKGHKVRLLEKLVTIGGVQFEPGEVLVITGSYRGRVHMHNPLRRNQEGWPLGVRSAGLKGLELCE